MLSPILETDRLILRRYRETDIDAMYEIITDERLSKYIRFPNLSKSEELKVIKNWIKEAGNSKEEKWVIERKEDSVVIGSIQVNEVIEKHNYCSVGYTIRYDYWGNGYAAEALKRVSDYLLIDRNYYLVECSCHVLNKQSKRVLKKAGFKKDGYIANRELNRDGTYSAVEYYSKCKKI